MHYSNKNPCLFLQLKNRLAFMQNERFIFGPGFVLVRFCEIHCEMCGWVSKELC